jgi:hypothetical protein
MERGLNQRLYCLNSDVREDGSIHFHVLGTTGSEYTVVLKPLEKFESCTCPHHSSKGVICKHIYFCKHRVLSLPFTQEHVTLEDVTIFIEKREKKQITLTNENTVSKTKEKQEEEEEKGFVAQKEYINDQNECTEPCGICYEPFTKECQVDYCKLGCGKTLHLDCALRWVQKKGSDGQKVTCVYCRCPWKI